MSRVLAAIAIGVGVGFFLISLLVGTKASDGFLFAVGVTVAVVPEGLLPTVTLSLAIGAQRMAARHALVRHLEAVETLGSTTFIATDKTGTLTRNEMAVVEVWMPSGTTVVKDGGYTPDAEVECTPLSCCSEAMQLARAAALSSSGRVDRARWFMGRAGRSHGGSVGRLRAPHRRRHRPGAGAGDRDRAVPVRRTPPPDVRGEGRDGDGQGRARRGVPSVLGPAGRDGVTAGHGRARAACPRRGDSSRRPHPLFSR